MANLPLCDSLRTATPTEKARFYEGCGHCVSLPYYGAVEGIGCVTQVSRKLEKIAVNTEVTEF